MKFFMLIFGFIISSTAVFAQINEKGLLAEEFKGLPTSSNCEAWKIGQFGAPDTLAGKVEISVLLENEPMVVVKSTSVDRLNFSFGRRIVGGEDRGSSTDYCAYFFDSSTENYTMRYFCSDLNERSWMNNTYSSISYSTQFNSYNLICKKAERGNGSLNVRNCWKLKNCI